MKATVITHEDLVRRMDESIRRDPALDISIDTAAQRMLRRLNKVAEAANKLGRDGVEIERVEYVMTKDPADPIWGVALEVRVVPKLKLKTPAANPS